MLAEDACNAQKTQGSGKPVVAGGQALGLALRLFGGRCVFCA